MYCHPSLCNVNSIVRHWYRRSILTSHHHHSYASAVMNVYIWFLALLPPEKCFQSLSGLSTASNSYLHISQRSMSSCLLKAYLRQCAEEFLASFTESVELPQLLLVLQSNQHFQIIVRRLLRCSRTQFHLSSKLSKSYSAGGPSLCKANSWASRQGLVLTIPQAILKVQRKAVPRVVQVTTQVSLKGPLQQSANGFWPWLTSSDAHHNRARLQIDSTWAPFDHSV